MRISTRAKSPIPGSSHGNQAVKLLSLLRSNQLLLNATLEGAGKLASAREKALLRNATLPQTNMEPEKEPVVFVDYCPVEWCSHGVPC